MCCWCELFAFCPDVGKERVRTLMGQKCKCASGDCYTSLAYTEVKNFLDVFESRTKREQDAILYMACENDVSKFQASRKEYLFLGVHLRRQCFERLLGLSSHRVDKIGAIDLRYKDTKRPSKPSHLTASIDAFVMVLYNSVAEPLPTKHLVFEE